MVILSHPDFIAGRHSTRWVEDRLDLSGLTSAPSDEAEIGESGEQRVLREVTAEVDGRRYQVRLWVPDVSAAGGARGTRPHKPRATVAGSGSGTVSVPMQGTIVKVLVIPGDAVEVGQTVCVLEAMKMENAITAEKAGTVKEVKVAAGDSVGPGDVIAVIE